MTGKLLDGPRRTALSGKTRSLVVLLHGYGANGDDLIPLADEWRAALPDTAFVSPNAPESIPGYVGGLQWFGLSERTPERIWSGVTAARAGLDAFLDAELKRHMLTADRFALVGFSQGTMMALHVGLRRPAAAAGIVGYSGRLAGAEKLAGEIRSRPPVLLVHGDDDELIPVAAMQEARLALTAAGVVVESHGRPGLGHGIDAHGLMLGAALLQRVLR